MFGRNLPLITITLKVDMSLYPPSSPHNRRLVAATVRKVLNKAHGIRRFVMLDDSAYGFGVSGGGGAYVDVEVFGNVDPNRLVNKLAREGIHAWFHSGSPKGRFVNYSDYYYDNFHEPYPYPCGHGPGYGYGRLYGGVFGSGGWPGYDDGYCHCYGDVGGYNNYY
ncbi:OLC1v1022310C1 [Oldenlandia corymbosa var. corymbosa]|uniref:OLC1v1022310C1 n=1 Tax=Oldenlandia corymbosa var. corymbosa TaxID=529605 RepID=A0AAV1BXK8_OLDCO|nr:OLC1v1022310C1 [Oldenlandia corymbosa var. corymbosa]